METSSGSGCRMLISILPLPMDPFQVAAGESEYAQVASLMCESSETDSSFSAYFARQRLVTSRVWLRANGMIEFCHDVLVETFCCQTCPDVVSLASSFAPD